MKELKQYAPCEKCDAPIDTTQTLPGQIHINEGTMTLHPPPVVEPSGETPPGPPAPEPLREAPHVQEQKEAELSGYYCRPACLIAKIRDLGPAKPVRELRKRKGKGKKR